MTELPSSSPPSVLILTKDEEVNIGACLDCFKFTDDVVVLDSCSTDRTVEIARKYANVRVASRPFDNEYNQRTFGLHEIEYRHPWVYVCDADERVPAELAREIVQVINAPGCEEAAFRLRYKNMYLGRWIKRSSGYPVWLVRLVRPDRVRYEHRETNIHLIIDGNVGELRENFVHYSFNKGLVPWFHKHNYYSQLESHEAQRVLGSTTLGEHLRHTFDRDKFVRRRAFKNLSFFPPLRGPIRFLYMYLLRLGLLDGGAGFHYASMISMYEYWIELKVRELRSKWRERTDALAERMLREGAP